MRTYCKLLLLLIIYLLPIYCFAKEDNKIIIDNKIEIDKSVHDFGDVKLSDGVLSCSFNVKNISKEVLIIYNVVTSCGCTNVSWDKAPIRSGKSGKINVSFKNDQGPYPFDKDITVYFSTAKKPVILRIRGVVHEKMKSLEELYPIHFGKLGFKKYIIKGNNLSQGEQSSDIIRVANISNKPIFLSFENISEGLKLSLDKNPIPQHSTANISYTITANREMWGKNIYSFVPLINKKRISYKVANDNISSINILAYTKENFINWTKEQKDNAALPIFKESTINLGKIGNENTKAVFQLSNRGKSALKIYKIDCDSDAISNLKIKDIPAMSNSSLEIYIDGNKIEKGEFSYNLLLTTNSPSRPLITLFIFGEKS